MVGPAAHEAAGSGPLGPEHAHTELSLGGTTCRAIATELGVDLICPAPDVAALPPALGLPEASEDAAEILSVGSQVQVPYGRFHNAVLTRNFSTIERSVEEMKLYAKGVGPVMELLISGGSGRTELLSYTKG